MSIKLFDQTAKDMSRKLALNYSTSFSLGIRLLSKEYRWAVFAIYGLVRVADEIVDTFHGFNKAQMLSDFKAQAYQSIEEGISTNPVLHAFQLAANQFGIGKDLIDPFFYSMEEDLQSQVHSEKSYNDYIFGSAEVVGLMCLKVFCAGNENTYNFLCPMAKSLGSAFQKVNFLRDIQSDMSERGRVYFPGVNFETFSDSDKRHIVLDVKNDFNKALPGIKKLPVGCRLGVYTAYQYYLELVHKIERKSAVDVVKSRVRIRNSHKFTLLVKSFFCEKLMPA
ncbi:MAG: phytoene/squalene synthase family protein [Bacteroidetes bacterium]|nr:phytoene/squalene synthase family protein [Bacteroidota bacterium]